MLLFLRAGELTEDILKWSKSEGSIAQAYPTLPIMQQNFIRHFLPLKCISNFTPLVCNAGSRGRGLNDDTKLV